MMEFIFYVIVFPMVLFCAVIFFMQLLDRGEPWYRALCACLGWPTFIAMALLEWSFDYLDEKERKRKENKHYTTEF